MIPCPKCGCTMSPMPPMELRSVEVAFCNGCQGMWLETSRLDPAVLERADLVRVPGRGMAPGRASRYPCPSGHGNLVEHEAPVGSSIHVDQCDRCGGVFLDRGEYRRIRKFLETPAGKGKAAPPAAEGGADVDLGFDTDSGWVKLFQFVSGMPLEIDTRQRIFSPAVSLLIVANIAVFAASIGYGLDSIVARFGLVPAKWMAQPATALTSGFLHAGPGHLFGNLYFLFMAGDNVEERLGTLGFLALYFFGMIAADAAYVARHLTSTIPLVGASGAISAVMGAYIVFFPRDRFLVRWFYLLWFHASWRIPAWVYFLGWIALQFLFEALGLPGTAWLAHIGGFLTGALMAASVRLLGAPEPVR